MVIMDLSAYDRHRTAYHMFLTCIDEIIYSLYLILLCLYLISYCLSGKPKLMPNGG